MLEDVVRELRHRKLVGSFREVDRAVGADVEIVETTKLHAVCFLGKHFHFACFLLVNCIFIKDRLLDF